MRGADLTATLPRVIGHLAALGIVLAGTQPLVAARTTTANMQRAALQAAVTTGLEVSLRTPDHISPRDKAQVTLVVTNGTTSTCEVSTSVIATVITGIEHDGQRVLPKLSAPAYFTYGLQSIDQGLTAVPPGSSIELALPARTGELASISRLEPDEERGLVAAWPLLANGTYRIHAQLAPGAVRGCDPPPPASGEFRVAADQDLSLPVLAVVLIAALALALLLVLRRRRGGPAVLMLLALAGSLFGRPGTADAKVVVANASAAGKAIVAGCFKIFEAPDGDPLGFYGAAKASGHTITIIDGFTKASETDPDDPVNMRVPGKGSDATINYVPVSTGQYDPVIDGAPPDDCAMLYHELSHGFAMSYGQVNTSRCPSGLTLEEARATLAENEYRKRHGLPVRTAYTGKALPKTLDECVAKKAPAKTPFHYACDADDACGESSGEPHLRTYDRYKYDFMAVGEFVLTRSDDRSFEIQVRQAPFGDATDVSVNVAVAARMGAHRVVVQAQPRGVAIAIDGTTQPDDADRVDVGGGDSLEVVHAWTTIVALHWADGSSVYLPWLGGYGLDTTVDLATSWHGRMQGLLGNYDGERTGDLRLPDGSALSPQPSFADVQRRFADAWRVTADTSLFDYAPGTSTDTFTDRAFPAQPVDVQTAPGRDTVRLVCQELGVADTDPETIDDCIYDLLVTGQGMFGTAAGARRPTDGAVPAPTPAPTSPGGPSVTVSDVASVGGATVGPDGTLYIDVRNQTGTYEVRAISAQTGHLLRSAKADDLGALAYAAGSIWVGAFSAASSGCSITRLASDTLAVLAVVPISCTVRGADFTVAGDSIWFIDITSIRQAGDRASLRAIDPQTSKPARDDVPLPFNNGYLATSGEAIFYTDFGQPMYRYQPGDPSWTSLGVRSSTNFAGVGLSGNGVWVMENNRAALYRADGPAQATIAMAGTLIAADSRGVYADVATAAGDTLVLYRADGSVPTRLATAPNSASQALSYFSNSPVMLTSSTFTKIWMAEAADGPVLLVQQTPLS